MKPSAPSRVTSTASRTVPKPVITMAMMSGIAGEAPRRGPAGRRRPGRRRSVIRMSKANSLEPLEGLFAGAGLRHPKSVLGEPFGHDLAERRLVVDEQEMLRSWAVVIGEATAF